MEAPGVELRFQNSKANRHVDTAPKVRPTTHNVQNLANLTSCELLESSWDSKTQTSASLCRRCCRRTSTLRHVWKSCQFQFMGACGVESGFQNLGAARSHVATAPKVCPVSIDVQTLANLAPWVPVGSSWGPKIRLVQVHVAAAPEGHQSWEISWKSCQSQTMGACGVSWNYKKGIVNVHVAVALEER